MQTKQPLTQSKQPLKSELNRLKQLILPESQARSKGYHLVAGIDEAGRGPLAGPVVAAACMIEEGVFFVGINDSKLIAPKKRREIFEALTTSKSVRFGVGVVDHTEIDQINILQATLKAMRMAVERLSTQPDFLLVDGVHLDYHEIAAEKLIKGDQRSQMIAAASVIAKETRDEIMLNYHQEYPAYGFDQHKGYGTAKHREALLKFGPCPIHRRSFAPIRAC